MGADAGRRVHEAVTRLVRWAGRPDVRVALLGPAGGELSVNDVTLLRAVVASGPVRASDLADRQGVDKSTISTQIRRLEERGLVTRRPDPGDRRAVLLTATAAGRRMRQRMDAAGAALFAEHLRDWDDADRVALAALLDRFSRRLTEGRARAGDPDSGRSDLTSAPGRATVVGMTRPTIRAIIEDGPRAGETLEVDAEAEGTPPKEFLLTEEHVGEHPDDGPKAPPSGAVSTYRLVGEDEGRGGYVYRVAQR